MNSSDLNQKARRGEPISRVEKISTLHTIAECDGFAWGAEMSGAALTSVEQAALATRAAEIMKAAAKKQKRGGK